MAKHKARKVNDSLYEQLKSALESKCYRVIDSDEVDEWLESCQDKGVCHVYLGDLSTAKSSGMVTMELKFS